VLSLTLVLLALAPDSWAASLAYSTYLKDGLTPNAMVSDAQGNLYLAGTAVTDPLSGATTAVVAKLDPHAAGFLYLAYLDGAASDEVRAIAVDSAGNAYVAGPAKQRSPAKSSVYFQMWPAPQELISATRRWPVPGPR
jgi:hypothetical protein